MSNINNIESGFIDNASVKAHETTVNPETKSELNSKGTYIDNIYVHNDPNSNIKPSSSDLPKQSGGTTITNVWHEEVSQK